jgi:hypothetical protein
LVSQSLKIACSGAQLTMIEARERKAAFLCEAVRALVTARVLDVRRGDGTYVTSLRPELLLAGIGAAVDLMNDRFTLELVQVRRILEPAATGMAASRITDAMLAELDTCLHRMSVATSNDELVQFDEQFHHLVVAAAGNATLASMLAGVSGRTTRGRVWRGVVEAGATERTIASASATPSSPKRRHWCMSRQPKPGSEASSRPKPEGRWGATNGGAWGG